MSLAFFGAVVRPAARLWAVPAAALGCAVVLLSGGQAWAQNTSPCGSLQNPYGPFDYRSDKKNWGTVDFHHFTPEVEALVRGKSGSIGQDIDYALKVAPNHHRALMAVMRWGEKLKTPHPKDLTYPVECYFDRAIRMAPDDTIVRMIYAIFLTKQARIPEADKQLQEAIVLAKDNSFAHYNIGLVYFDMKDYDHALAQAHKAYGMGFMQPALRDQLKSVGKWVEPPPETSAADTSAAPAPAPKP